MIDDYNSGCLYLSPWSGFVPKLSSTTGRSLEAVRRPTQVVRLSLSVSGATTTVGEEE